MKEYYNETDKQTNEERPIARRNDIRQKAFDFFIRQELQGQLKRAGENVPTLSAAATSRPVTGGSWFLRAIRRTSAWDLPIASCTRRPALTNATIHYTKYRVGCESTYCFRVKTFSLEGTGWDEGARERKVESFSNCSRFFFFITMGGNGLEKERDGDNDGEGKKLK